MCVRENVGRGSGMHLIGFKRRLQRVCFYVVVVTVIVLVFVPAALEE